MVVHNCNPSTQEAEAGGSQIRGQPGPYSEKEREGKRREGGEGRTRKMEGREKEGKEGGREEGRMDNTLQPLSILYFRFLALFLF
jgi:hypothetical protein